MVFAQAKTNFQPQFFASTDTSTPTPTDISTPTQIYTATQVITSTVPIPDTPTPETTETLPPATPSPTELSDRDSPVSLPPETWWKEYFPYISLFRLPTTTDLFCSQGSSINIPDNDPDGISNDLQIETPGVVLDVNIYVNINHAWIGDLRATLVHQGSGIRVELIDRPGMPATSLGCGYDHIQTILDDEASQPAEDKCGTYPAGIAGIFKPSSPLNSFDHQWTSGTWTLVISDHASYDTGKLQKWCLEIISADPSATPIPDPTPISLPFSASISGVTGKDQALPLDCESRSAVDWAKFFGVSIPELEFYNRLPHSDNPEKGFVGNVNGAWGNIPPGDYGVHAAPVAALLRDYGVNARAYQALRWDDIRAEIASGKPVIVWVTGHANSGRYPSGAPQYYIAASDQSYTVVANYEHTVIVKGYTSTSVTIQDGSTTYTRNLVEFLDSWSALRNMAILARP